MVQGETQSSNSEVASEFYFSDVALYFDYFLPSYDLPPFLPTGEGRGAIIVCIYILHTFTE